MVALARTQPDITAATYERVSTMGQARHGFSLAAQHSSTEEFVIAQGWLLPEHLRFRDGEEQNASGADWDLPALNTMLAAAKARQFSVLVVPDLDRFARSMVKGLVLEEQLKKYGVRVVYQRVPVEDSPEGRLLKNQLFSFAEYEREKIRLRTMNGIREKALSGRVVGEGLPPFGYRFTHEKLSNGKLRTSGLKPDKRTAPIIRRILDALLTQPAGDICRTLNAARIPGPGGGLWHVKTVCKMARNPVYMGVWVHGKNGRTVRPGDGIGIPVTVPSIISPEQWERVQDALTHRRRARRGRYTADDDPFLLRGMLSCGHCHGLLRAERYVGTRYYRCGCAFPSDAQRAGKPVCSLPVVRAEAIEDELFARIAATLLDDTHLREGIRATREQYRAADALRRDRIAALDVEIARKRKRLDVLAARLGDLGDGELYDAALRQARDTEALLQGLRRERDTHAARRPEGLSEDESTALLAFAADVRAGLMDATSADRRALYELLRVRGRVTLDPDGVALGRTHHFAIDWETVVRQLDCVAESSNQVMLFRSPGDGFAILSGYAQAAG